MATFEQASGKENIHSVSQQTDTVSDKMLREADLVLTAIPGTFRGVANRAYEVATSKEAAIDVSCKMGAAALLATGIGILSKTGGIPGLVGQYAPKVLGYAVAFDVGTRLGKPMYETWTDPALAEKAKTDLGNSLGAGVFDYAVMGVGAKAGFKYGAPAYEKAVNRMLDGPAVRQPLQRAIEALPRIKEPPKAISSADVDRFAPMLIQGGVRNVTVNHDLPAWMAVGGAVELMHKI